jgi:hypothetical protein
MKYGTPGVWAWGLKLQFYSDEVLDGNGVQGIGN